MWTSKKKVKIPVDNTKDGELFSSPPPPLQVIFVKAFCDLFKKKKADVRIGDPTIENVMASGNSPPDKLHICVTITVKKYMPLSNMHETFQKPNCINTVRNYPM